jgi:hypothetical protein
MEPAEIHTGSRSASANERDPGERLTLAVMRAALCLIGCALACDRGRPSDPPPAPARATATAPAVPGCTLAPVPLKRPAARRLVAIGDLHGDVDAARDALRAALSIDERGRWIGGDLVVVQTGDVLDRGDSERALLDLLVDLGAQARAAGGALIALTGNHELMNAAGDYRYVTAIGARAFDGVQGPTAPGLPERWRSRYAALGPGGPYARRLAEHGAIAIVGDTVFSHAGVLGRWVARADEVNQSARCWLDGQTGDRPEALTAEDSPVWTRGAGGDTVDCAQVRRALDELGASRMVVGHTVQGQGINAACDGALWRIDTGLARHYGGPIEVLELAVGAPPRVVTGTRSAR